MEEQERYKYYNESQYILDTLTGFTYHCNNEELYNLLNEYYHQAETYARKYYNLKYK